MIVMIRVRQSGGMLDRVLDAIRGSRERKRSKLRDLLCRAMPFCDTHFAGGWSMEKLIEKIMEICDGKG